MIEIIDEQNIAPPLDAKIRAMLCVCFPEWAEVFACRRVWHNTPPIFTVLLREDGEIAAHVAVVVRTITTTWNWRYNVASIQGVSVVPEKRGNRIGRELLDVTVNEIKRRGFFFAILFCKESLVPYYISLGWQLADDSMVMWNNRDLPIAMRSNCPMYKELTDVSLPEGPLDVHSPTL
ncbi:MAG: GNAT family N-acetyltransferase [Planctomycetaceae bacterium]|jgi:predicted N-acetyltransferase YhbS|nr:GNAT family N-acetyltransferase [Planctomycetaceae bacterium]